MADWKEVRDDHFLYQTGAVSRVPGVQAKWNIVGTSATLWAPRGPGYGSADICLDGVVQRRISFHADALQKSQPRWTIKGLGDAYHSVSLLNPAGTIPLDVLEVIH